MQIKLGHGNKKVPKPSIGQKPSQRFHPLITSKIFFSENGTDSEQEDDISSIEEAKNEDHEDKTNEDKNNEEKIEPVKEAKKGKRVTIQSHEDLRASPEDPVENSGSEKRKKSKACILL